MDNIVKLVFQSVVAGSGFDDFLRKTEASIANSNQLGQSMSVMSSKLGTVGAAIGGVIGNLVKGSLWGAATAGIMGVVEAIKKWRAEAALAAEANEKAFKATIDAANSAAEQLKSAYQKSNERIDAAAKKKKEDIELTNKQTKAELELAAAKAKAAGKDKEAAALESKAGAVDAKGNEQSAAVDVNAAKEKLDAAKKAASGLPGWKNTNGNKQAYDNLDAIQKKLGETYQKKIDEYASNVADTANKPYGILASAGKSILKFFGFGREATGKTKVMLRGDELGKPVTKERVSEAIRAGGVTDDFRDFLKNDKEYSEAQLNLSAARKAIDAQKGSSLFNRTTGKDFEFDPRAWEKERRRRIGEINRLEMESKEKQVVTSPTTGTSMTVKTNRAIEAEKQLNGFDDGDTHFKGAKEAYADFIVQMKKARQAAQDIADAERVLAKARKEEKIAIAENQKSIVVAKAAAAKASKDEMLKKYQGEKSGYDTRRQSASSEVSRWQGEFNAAFDLWRDPEAAASAVEADKKRGEDMKRFRKEVNRYGGKGKIDEYAQLMRAGDEEGMQERLTQWRKSSKFTPQVEQMVKAAAADQNRNAAEKSLANIEKNTADLAKKIDQILSIK